MNPIQKIETFNKTTFGIYSVLKNETGALYDGKAKAYEKMVSSYRYNKIMWGTSPSDYTDFSKKAILDSKGTGLDIGCGGLIQTANQYKQTNNDFILLDNSIEMLKVAKSRIESQSQNIPKNIGLLQADSFNIPFDNDSFDIVCCFGVLHIFDNKEALINEALRVLDPKGHFFFTALTSDRFISRLYMSLLRTQGEFGKPNTSKETLALFENCINLNWYVKGSMLFVSGQKK